MVYNSDPRTRDDETAVRPETCETLSHRSDLQVVKSSWLPISFMPQVFVNPRIISFSDDKDWQVLQRLIAQGTGVRSSTALVNVHSKKVKKTYTTTFQAHTGWRCNYVSCFGPSPSPYKHVLPALRLGRQRVACPFHGLRLGRAAVLSDAMSSEQRA